MEAADDPRRFQVDYRIRFDEAGADGRLRPSGYVRFAQDIAWQHSEARGFDRPWYRERHVQWLVRWVELQLLSPARYGETVGVSTRVVGGRRALARRRTEVRGDAGELRAVVLTDWILVSDTGRPARVPEEIVDAFSDGATFEPGRTQLGDVPSDARAVQLTVRAQDVDPMRHVNNATYLDYLDELLGPAEAGRARRYRLEFLRPAVPDETLMAAIWSGTEGWSVAVSGEAGEAVLRAIVGVDPGG